MTVKEAAEKWDVAEEYVQMLCREGKIANAQKVSGKWVIPDDAQLVKKSTTARSAKQEDSETGNGWLIGLIILGIVLSLAGGGLLVNSSVFFGLVLLAIGAGILTFLGSGFFPNLKAEVLFAIIALVAVVCSALLFGVGGGSSSGGRSWGDLSDTEKDNARWAYEANQYIDSLD